MLGKKRGGGGNGGGGDGPRQGDGDRGVEGGQVKGDKEFLQIDEIGIQGRSQPGRQRPADNGPDRSLGHDRHDRNGQDRQEQGELFPHQGKE